MLDMLINILPEIIGGLLAILCAIIGAKIATESNSSLAYEKELRDAYADVFAGYYARLESDSGEALVKLITAIERACLICSAESERIMRQTVPIVSEIDINASALGVYIRRLREEAKKDVKNASGKHTYSKHKQK